MTWGGGRDSKQRGRGPAAPNTGSLCSYQLYSLVISVTSNRPGPKRGRGKGLFDEKGSWSLVPGGRQIDGKSLGVSLGKAGGGRPAGLERGGWGTQSRILVLGEATKGEGEVAYHTGNDALGKREARRFDLV